MKWVKMNRKVTQLSQLVPSEPAELAWSGLTGHNIVAEAINAKHSSSFRSQLVGFGGALTPASLSQRWPCSPDPPEPPLPGRQKGVGRFVHLFGRDEEREAAPRSLPLCSQRARE